MAASVVLRELAALDLSDAIAYYRGEAGESTAIRFIDAVERSVQRIGRSPGVGSLSFAYELSIPGLRAWPIARFPFIVFYREAAGVVEVLRILHARRDVPASLIPE